MKKAGVGVGMAAALMVVGTWLAGAGVATATLPNAEEGQGSRLPGDESPVLPCRQTAQRRRGPGTGGAAILAGAQSRPAQYLRAPMTEFGTLKALPLAQMLPLCEARATTAPRQGEHR